VSEGTDLAERALELSAQVRLSKETRLTGLLANRLTELAAALLAAEKRAEELTQEKKLLIRDYEECATARDIARERAEEAEGALRRIAERECGIVHGGMPHGSTCLDKQAHARDLSNRYSEEFRATILSPDYPCLSCQARAALSGGTKQ
jgi:hypothetical protein